MVSYKKQFLKKKFKKNRKKKFFLKNPFLWVVLSTILILSALAYFLIFSDKIQIKNFLIEGAHKIDEKNFKNFVQENIEIKLIDLSLVKISSKSIFLFNSSKLKQILLKEYPPLEDVKIKKILPDILEIKVKEREAIGIYSYAQEEEGAVENFLIDKNGIIFQSNPTLADDYFIIKKLNSVKNELGVKVVDESIISQLLEIKKNLEENFGIKLKEVFIATPFKVEIKTNEGWKIYFNLQDEKDLEIELVKLNLLLENEILPEKRKELKYIDLRFKDKAQVMPSEVLEK